MKYRAKLSILAFLVWLPVQSLAAAALTGEQTDFLAAEKALERGDQKTFETLRKQLAGYPLAPYLDFAQLNARLAKAGADEVRAFIDSRERMPLGSRLLHEWLDLLAARGRWNEYLDFYRADEAGTTEQCWQARALLATGRTDEAWAGARRLWLVGRSQPSACDPLFAAWTKAGGRDDGLIWQRVALAMEEGEVSLARWLVEQLPSADRAAAANWFVAQQKPERLLATKAAYAPHAWRDAWLIHALVRFTRDDPLAAHAYWQRWRRDQTVDAEQFVQATPRLIRALSSTDQRSALAFLNDLVPEQTDFDVHETRVRTALGFADWDLALRWIGEMPAALAERATWRYWRARGLAERGHAGKSRSLLDALAGERDFYGFLAADRLGRDYKIAADPETVNAARIDALGTTPAARRIVELRALDRDLDARREWRDWTAALDADDLVAAAKLAARWDWHRQAILTVARAEEWDHLDLRFPIAYRDAIERNAAAQSLEVDWVFGLVRQESAFDPAVRSPVGATGLMQLMPQTARSVARTAKLRRPRLADLKTADTNLRLGTTYLKSMLERFDGNRVLATAAYNAGPQRVKRWLPDAEMPADLWIETIPYRETRDYVRRVFAYSAIYRFQMGVGDGRRVSDWLAPVAAQV
ncbi:MAG: transglycosylase SLT domain-containing protein [Chromatiales bacterium]|nr:transglycosylase SLT domain-containing protein [Chromatiales bacterium]